MEWNLCRDFACLYASVNASVRVNASLVGNDILSSLSNAGSNNNNTTSYSSHSQPVINNCVLATLSREYEALTLSII